MKKQLRPSYLIGRVRGEEFFALLRESDSSQAGDVAERLRSAVATTPFSFGKETVTLTISIGIAESGEYGYNLEALLKHADNRLYEAKNKGRNRVETH